jgi:hypothetical protein
MTCSEKRLRDARWKFRPVSLPLPVGFDARGLNGERIEFGELHDDPYLGLLAYFERVNRALKYFSGKAIVAAAIANSRRAFGRFTWSEIHGFHGAIRKVEGERWHQLRKSK